jgi:endonuclease/exonuclease/phosphatase (EEP) superfamily protein YafD
MLSLQLIVAEKSYGIAMVSDWVSKFLNSHFVDYGCWLIILLLLLALVMRLFAHDALMILIWMNSFTFFLYLPSYPIFLYALVKRNWPLEILSLIIIVFHAFILKEKFSQLKPVCNEESRITLLSANLFSKNSRLTEILDEIRFVDPDIMALQEYTTSCHDLFLANNVFEKWPYNICLPRKDTFGSAILSKMRIIEAGEFHLDDASFPQTRAAVEINGRAVNLLNVHLIPPGIKAKSTSFSTALKN